MEELRLQALLPGCALVDQRLAQPHTRAQLEDLRRRDPRLRQFAGREQPQQQIAVSAVGLRPPLAPALGRRLRRVGQVRAVTGTLDRLDHEPPTGRAFERKVDLIDTVKLCKPRAHRLTSRRTDPAAGDLAAIDLDGQVRDLPAMNIKRAYDPHRDLLELHGLERPACFNTLVPRGSHHISSLWSPVVATGGNQWQITERQKPRNKRKPLPWIATGCLRHGKEGVDGSSAHCCCPATRPLGGDGSWEIRPPLARAEICLRWGDRFARRVRRSPGHSYRRRRPWPRGS